MPVSVRKPTAFVAIPCGDFYAVQSGMIREIASALGITAYIAEDDPGTKGLWEGIRVAIDEADIFIADISSRSPNILLEVGYAIARKPVTRIGLFLAGTSETPSDLRWLVVQIYSSLPSFREKLSDWLAGALSIEAPHSRPSAVPSPEVFTEDFMSEELFLRRWSTPPGCSYLFAPEGLRFSNAHFPILTTPLAILRDGEFEFACRIEREQLGWAIMGTQLPSDILPKFCVMIALNRQDIITPHIWSSALVDPQNHYQVFRDRAVRARLRKSKDGWITLLTRFREGVIEVENEGEQIFAANMAEPPYAEVYRSIPEKGGQVGFRCHPDEQATVRRVRVRSL